MKFRIMEAEVRMFALPLKSPFTFAYGRFDVLPRVFLKLHCAGQREPVIGWGEAAVDFPFVRYDAFDTFSALKQIAPALVGLNALDRKGLLERFSSSLAAAAPAALCAVNMALDDAAGQCVGRLATCFYGRARGMGPALASIGFNLDGETEAWNTPGLVPKYKMGRGIKEDYRVFQQAEMLAAKFKKQYTVDFNAAYSLAEVIELTGILTEDLHHSGNCRFWEQPLSQDSGIAEWKRLAQALAGAGGPRLVADESFVDAETGICLGMIGVGLNFKIHKLGGLAAAMALEKNVLNSGLVFESFIGGTLPSPLGRCYDRIAAQALKSASLPGDGLSSTEAYLAPEVVAAFQPSQTGIGCNVREEALTRFEVTDPAAEYQRLRNGLPGKQVNLALNGTYATLYPKPLNWNLYEKQS